MFTTDSPCRCLSETRVMAERDVFLVIYSPSIIRLCINIHCFFDKLPLDPQTKEEKINYGAPAVVRLAGNPEKSTCSWTWLPPNV